MVCFFSQEMSGNPALGYVITNAVTFA